MADRAPPLPMRLSESQARVHIPLPQRTSLIHHHHPHHTTQPHRKSACTITPPIRSIDQIKVETRNNDYVDTYKPALPPRNHRNCTNTHFSKTSQSHHKQSAELKVDCKLNHVVDLAVESPPPLLPRLPERKSRPTSAPPSHHRPTPTHGPPIRRDNKPGHFRSPQKAQQPLAVLFVDTPDTKPMKLSRSRSQSTTHKTNTITKEPLTLDKLSSHPEKQSIEHHVTLRNQDSVESTIRCPDCDKCRCKLCCEDQKLPERWICDGNCRLSADSCVDVLSCMCVAKGITYHICDEHDGEEIHPCDCTGPATDCCLRWSVLGLLTLCMPCLLCYLPLKGCCKANEKCYNSCIRTKGCQCGR